MKQVAFIVTLVALCSAAYAGGNIVKYDQPVDPQGYIFNSMNVVGLYNVADDFLCTATGPITDVHWYGGYFWVEGPNQIRGFNIRFYLDDGKNGAGRPGSLVYDTVYAGNANETDTGQYGGDGFKIWQYALNIEPFWQYKDHRYWLSVSVLPGWDPFPNAQYWGWRNAPTVTGNQAVQAFYGDHQAMWAGASQTGYDMAFSLTTVPEPGAVTALAGLLLGLGGIVLRRK